MAGKKPNPPTKAQLLKAISAARPYSSEYDNHQRAERANNPKLQRSERVGAELIASFLKTAGFDKRKFDGIRQRHDAALNRIVETQKSDALRRTPKMHRGLYAGMDARVTGVRDLADGHVSGPPPDAIHKPFLIWAGTHSSEILVDSRIVADRSWAKIRVAASNSERWNALDIERRLSFWFMWQSRSPNHEVVDVSAYLVLSGHAAASGASWILTPTNDGDEWTPPGVGHAALTSLLSAWTWWTQPPIPMVLDSEFNTSIYAEGGRYARFESKVVGANFGMSTWNNYLTVPPYATTIFEVAVAMDCFVDRGSVDIDFAGGDWRITCPFVLVRKPTFPPP